MQVSTAYLSSLTFALTSIVIGNAFVKKKQFYPSVVYITKSNTSMAVIYIQFFVVVFIFGKILRKIFMGTLRSTEFEHLLERFWYALTETCLAFTVFRDDFNPRFVALFTVLLFLKSFHWLAEERVDFMERSPVLGLLFHVRVLSLLVILGFLDYYLLQHAYNSTIVRGPTVQLVFGFEYGILLTVIGNIGIKYALHAAEMQTENQWENKAVFLLYTELIIGFIKVLLYVLFVVIMAKIYALPMFVFRPMFFTIRNFKKALSDVIMSRRAIRNMNTLYPDATSEELRLSDNICIICREDMTGNSKKLPCGHIFHTSCLRSWFQRQQTCPTCRLNILRNHNIPNDTTPDTSAVNTSAEQHGRFEREEISQDGNMPAYGNTSTEGMQVPHPSMIFSKPFPYFPPSLPTMPPNLSSLSTQELRNLEGNERRNIEERLKLLANIKLLIEASSALMNQYALVANHSNTSATESAISINTSGDLPKSEDIDVDSHLLSTSPQSTESQYAKSEEKNADSSIAANVADVTIEDIGREEYFTDTMEDVNLSELSEIRKRRLRYLHEAE